MSLSINSENLLQVHELSFSFLSSACYSLVFRPQWNQEQFHLTLLKEQEESLETFPFKTFYYIFPIINCQNRTCGQTILSFVCIQVKKLFYLSKL